jgi:hypothetical protein
VSSNRGRELYVGGRVQGERRRGDVLIGFILSLSVGLTL